MRLLPMLHGMLFSGACWDHNDDLSGQALGFMRQRQPALMKPVLRGRSHAGPAEMQACCTDCHAQLSRLTQREALRVIEKRKR